MSLFPNLPVMALEPLSCPHWIADEDGVEADRDALIRAAQAVLVAADHLTMLGRMAYACDAADRLSSASLALRAAVSLLR